MPVDVLSDEQHLQPSSLITYSEWCAPLLSNPLCLCSELCVASVEGGSARQVNCVLHWWRGFERGLMVQQAL